MGAHVVLGESFILRIYTTPFLTTRSDSERKLSYSLLKPISSIFCGHRSLAWIYTEPESANAAPR